MAEAWRHVEKASVEQVGRDPGNRHDLVKALAHEPQVILGRRGIFGGHSGPLFFGGMFEPICRLLRDEGSLRLVLAVTGVYRWYLAGKSRFKERKATPLRSRRAGRGGAAQTPGAQRRVPPRDLRAAARGSARQGARDFPSFPQARLYDRNRKLARTARRPHRVHHAPPADGGLKRASTNRSSC